MVRCRREQHLFGCGQRRTNLDGGDEDTFGGVTRPCLDETPVPHTQSIGFDRRGERIEREPWRTAPSVPRDEAKSVHECMPAIDLVQHRQHVRHRDEHREPRAPTALAVPRPHSTPAATISRGSTPCSRSPSTAFAITSVRPSSSPCTRRRRRCSIESIVGRAATSTSSPVIDTSKAHTSSANGSRVQPTRGRSARGANDTSPDRTRRSHDATGSPCAGNGPRWRRRRRRPRTRPQEASPPS